MRFQSIKCFFGMHKLMFRMRGVRQAKCGHVIYRTSFWCSHCGANVVIDETGGSVA